MQRARDIMVTRLITLKPNMDVHDAIGLLLKHKISGAPVVDDDNQFVGVFSERSCLSLLVEGAYNQLPTTKVFAFMNPDAKTITEDTDLLAVAQVFLGAKTRRLPVLRNGELVGQVSRRDVLRSVHDSLDVRRNNGSPLLYLSSLFERDNAPIA